MRHLFVVSLLASLVSVLTEPTLFTEVPKSGVALIFFGSARCPHCIEFTPIWETVEKVGMNGVKFGKVECLSNAELCKSQKIQYYPTVNLYWNGKLIEEYNGDRTQSAIFAYLAEKLEEFGLSKVEPVNESTVSTVSTLPADNLLDEKIILTGSDVTSEVALNSLKTIVAWETKENPSVNPSGSVVILEQNTLYVMTNATPWFIMFHSPNCAYCQRLLPIWDELGLIMKYRMNIGKVDCTKEKSLAAYYGIRGYPTLKLFLGENNIVDYNGARTLNSLEKFILGMTSTPPFIPVLNSDIPAILKEKSVAYFYIYNPKSADPLSLERFINATRTLRTKASIYISPDKSSKAHFNLAPSKQPETLLVYKKDSKVISPTLTSLESIERIRNWVIVNRFPIFGPLNSENSDEILGGDKLVVILIADPAIESQSIEDMQRIAAMKDDNTVIWVWLDRIQWKKYVKRVYGKDKIEGPRIVIADPKTEVYYDTDKEGKKFIIGSQVWEYIDDAIAGKLREKSSKGFLAAYAGWVGKKIYPIAKTFWLYPLSSTILVLVVLYAAYQFMNVNSETGSGRLDPKAE